MKIICESEKEKEEFLEACNVIHDFTVDISNVKTGTKLCVIDKYDGVSNEIIRVRTKRHRVVGICLPLDKYPILNFLAHLYDCNDHPEIREQFLINEEQFIKDNTPDIEYGEVIS